MVDLLWNNVIEKKSFAVWIVFDVESVTVGRAMDNTLSLLFFMILLTLTSREKHL
jgi:hypothetical protein